MIPIDRQKNEAAQPAKIDALNIYRTEADVVTRNLSVTT